MTQRKRKVSVGIQWEVVVHSERREVISTWKPLGGGCQIKYPRRALSLRFFFSPWALSDKAHQTLTLFFFASPTTPTSSKPSTNLFPGAVNGMNFMLYSMILYSLREMGVMTMVHWQYPCSHHWAWCEHGGISEIFPHSRSLTHPNLLGSSTKSSKVSSSDYWQYLT